MINKKCEDCKTKVPNFGTPEERKPRWCGVCSKTHPGAVNIRSKNCEDCASKQPSYGMSGS